MSDTPTKSPTRLLIGVLLGASAALIAIAVWQILNDQGAPVWVALAGSMMACAAAVIASQSRKK